MLLLVLALRPTFLSLHVVEEAFSRISMLSHTAMPSEVAPAALMKSESAAHGVQENCLTTLQRVPHAVSSAMVLWEARVIDHGLPTVDTLVQLFQTLLSNANTAISSQPVTLALLIQVVELASHLLIKSNVSRVTAMLHLPFARCLMPRPLHLCSGRTRARGAMEDPSVRTQTIVAWPPRVTLAKPLTSSRAWAACGAIIQCHCSPRRP